MFEARLKLVGLVGRSTVNAVTFHRVFVFVVAVVDELSFFCFRV